jgi:hypothetical protein
MPGAPKMRNETDLSGSRCRANLTYEKKWKQNGNGGESGMRGVGNDGMDDWEMGFGPGWG